MRVKLKDRLGKRGRFTAQISRFGLKRSSFGTQPTCLVKDVRDESGDLITDHLWFRVGKLLRGLALAEGDEIEFYATVGSYEKADPDLWMYEDDGHHRITDYCLKYPNGIRKLGADAVENPLPLFDGEVDAER